MATACRSSIMMRLALPAALAWAALTWPAAPASGADAATRPAAPAGEKDQATLDREFSELLTNARLTGSYTASDAQGTKSGDGYTILKAVRSNGDVWTFTAQISYKGVGVPIDLDLPVKWAGDTPVITLTNHKIPGMGAFTVRLLFYGKQYAGTWSSARHGGLMWGTIEKVELPKAADPLIQPAKPNK